MIVLLVIVVLAVIALLLFAKYGKGTPVQPPQPPPPPPPSGGLPNGVTLTLVVQTTAVPKSDVTAYLAAQQAQLDKDFSPAWGGSATFVAEGGWPIYLEDTSDVAGALGYHDVDASGVPYARVFVKTSARAGISWQSVASHEVLEMLADANATTTVVGPDGCNWYREVGDPCEDLSYFVNSVELSDFVFPSWFDPNGQRPFDKLGGLSAPFTVTPGGYAASDCGTAQGRVHSSKGWSVDKDYA